MDHHSKPSEGFRDADGPYVTSSGQEQRVLAHLDGLWVVQMVTQLHQNLRHPVWDVVGRREDAGAEAQHAGVAPHQVYTHAGVSMVSVTETISVRVPLCT